MASSSRRPRVQSITTQRDSTERAASDWNEETSRTGKKYYFNKRTKGASWEKPYELMTQAEKLIATTNWREAIAASNGKKFYYNTVTRVSTWSTPEEVKMVNAEATDWREEYSREGKRYWYNTVTQISQWATPVEVKLARARANMNHNNVPTEVGDGVELTRERPILNLNEPAPMEEGGEFTRERANLNLNLNEVPVDDVELAPEETQTSLNDVPPPVESRAEKAGELVAAVENLRVEAPLPPKKKRAWRIMNEE